MIQGNLGVCQLFGVDDMGHHRGTHSKFRCTAQHSDPTAHGSEPAIDTNTRYLAEEMMRYKGRGPYGHGVPAGTASHHTEPAWAVSVMLSILQRLRSHMPNMAGECMPTKNPIKFANQFVRLLCQLVREHGGMNVENQTVDPAVVERILICLLHHKIDKGDWRTYTMITVDIRNAAHEAVATLYNCV